MLFWWIRRCGQSALPVRDAACYVPEEFRVLGFSLDTTVHPESSVRSRRQGERRVNAAVPASGAGTIQEGGIPSNSGQGWKEWPVQRLMTTQ